MADLTDKIDQLIGRLTGNAGGGRSGSTKVPATELRPSDPGFADVVAGLLGMPLDQYVRTGAPLEIRVPWCRDSLWFVPAPADAERLGGEGVSRGRIWTAAELSQLMALPGLTPAVVETLARAKLAVGGDIVEVRPRETG